MVKGYGYSVWYVPENFLELQTTYNITHIPHVTYQTNFDDFNSALKFYQQLPSNITIDFDTNVTLFPQMYSSDPLRACGFYITKSPYLNPSFNPHMSTKYFKPENEREINEYLNQMEKYDKPFQINCFKAISDNRNLDASTWSLLISCRSI